VIIIAAVVGFLIVVIVGGYLYGRLEYRRIFSDEDAMRDTHVYVVGELYDHARRGDFDGRD
jgi:hypothetical protein